jgi:hypothetical protein
VQDVVLPQSREIDLRIGGVSLGTSAWRKCIRRRNRKLGVGIRTNPREVAMWVD